MFRPDIPPGADHESQLSHPALPACGHILPLPACLAGVFGLSPTDELVQLQHFLIHVFLRVEEALHRRSSRVG